MRDGYPLTVFLTALSKWELHEKKWIDSLEKAKQPKPDNQQVQIYRSVWIEGYCESIADANEATES
jgi:hypothetical protein